MGTFERAGERERREHIRENIIDLKIDNKEYKYNFEALFL
jgi:hypothetical protein